FFPTRRSSDLHGAAQQIGDVDLARLERGGACRLLRDAAQHQPLDDWRLSPVPFVGLEHELDAGVEADESVGSGADRRLLEAVVTDLLHVLLGYNPARPRRRGTIERHEVGPRLLEEKAHAAGVDDLNLAHSLLEESGTAAPVAV